MKILLGTLLFVFMPLAHGQTSQLSFSDIKLVDFSKFALSQLLNKSFVADDHLLNDQRRITLDIKADQSGNIEQVLTELLSDYGYTTVQQSGIFKIKKKESKNEDLQTFIYRPKYRTASYLIDTTGLGTTGKTVQRDNAWSGGGSTSPAGPGGQQEAGSASQYIDKSADIVLIKLPEKELEQTRRTLEAVDQPASQADIKVAVYEYSSTEKNDSAYGAIVEIANKKLGVKYGALESIGDFFRLETKALQILVSALATDSRFTLVSSPNIRAKSGVRARVNVGQDVPTLGSTTQNNGSTTQSVNYQKTGITFDVTANVLISAIDLNIKQTLSEAIRTTTGVNGTPTLTNREIATQTVLKSGDSVIIGGLHSSRDGVGRTGLSFMPRWLDSSTKDFARTEIIVFLTATQVK